MLRVLSCKDETPRIHYGNIVSWDEVVKAGRTMYHITRPAGKGCVAIQAVTDRLLYVVIA